MIGKTEDVKCPWCFETSKLIEWDEQTYDRCTNREMKRLYMHLSDERAFMKTTQKYYICPKCGKWSLGCWLKIVNTTNERLKKLGGLSMIKVNDKKN